MIVRWAIWLILAKASPLKPYVPIEVRSSKVFSLDVVNLSQRIGRSSFYVRVSKHQGALSLCGTVTDINTMAVVGDLKQLQPSILDDNLDGCRASIHCIFNQLLQSMNRGDYDFAGSDLVDNILIKSLDKPISCDSALGLIRTCYLDPFWSLAS